MQPKSALRLLEACLLLSLAVHPLSSLFAQGTAFTYQGRFDENGSPFNGLAEFQFTLWDAPSNGVQVAAAAPPSVIVNVSNGLFSVPVDFGSGAFTGADRWLQIQARTALGPFVTLSPRQRLTATPYSQYSMNALSATTLSAPIADYLLSSNIARLQSSPVFTGTVSAALFAGNGSGLTGISQLDGSGGGPTGALSVDSLGHVAIGTNNSGAALEIAGGGTFINPVFRTAVTNNPAGAPHMSSPINVFLSGSRAYVTTFAPGSLEIFDISNPLQPAFLGEAVDDTINSGSPFKHLNGAEGIFVTNNVAYVTSENDNTLTIMNVSNPASPTKLAELVNGTGGITNLNLPTGVLVSGNKAFVLGFFSSALSVFDVSNPANPVLVGQALDDSVQPGSAFTKLKWPYQMTLSGSLLYIASRGDNAVTILNVANPANPQLVAEIVDATVNPLSPFTGLRNANWVDVAGNVLYVAAGAFNSSLGSLTLIDVSNPANPIKLAELNDDVVQTNSPFTKLAGAWAVNVVDDVALVTCWADNALTVIDVSDPHHPRLVRELVQGEGGFGTLQFTEGLASQGDNAYVVGSSSGALNVFTLHSSLGLAVNNYVGIGTSTPRSALDVAGTISATSLNVDNRIRVSGNWDGDNGALEIAGDKPTIRFTGGPPAGNQSWILHVGSDGPGDFGIFHRTGPGSYQNLFSLPATAGGATRFAGDLQIGTGGGDYHYLQLGGGNSSGFLYGSFPAFADGIHLGYNYYADASGVGHVVNAGGGTSRLTAGYGFLSLSVGGVNSAPTTTRLYADTSGVSVYGTFNNYSDRNAKQDFAPINPSRILEKVAQLPLSEWSYKEDPATRHVGPMAQDFYTSFNIGTDDKHIAPIDEGGVALAAIQALNRKLEETRAELKRRDAENAELKRKSESLANRLETLERIVRQRE